MNDAFGDDLAKAGELSLPITLIILIIAFGSLVAAGIALLLALTAVLGTMGLLALVSQVFPFDQSIGALVLLIGLAVGVDYGGSGARSSLPSSGIRLSRSSSRRRRSSPSGS